MNAIKRQLAAIHQLGQEGWATTEPTRPTLQSITADGPVHVRERGAGDDAMFWTVPPERFDALVEFINNHGGPDAWMLEPAN